MASLAELREYMDFEMTPVSMHRGRRKGRGPYTLTWTDVQATALPAEERWYEKLKRLKKNDVATSKPRTVLNGVSGLAEPGRILAIMGASGSGKTTLLNVLSGRPYLQGNLFVEGSVLANGNAVTEAFSKRNIAYVEQVDLFIPAVTAREHLNFHATLRMESDTSPRLREEMINKVLIQLGLGDTSETTIKMLSGGEKKRLSFATELLTDPYLMLCDEPTCGLDSFMAETVISALKDLAAQGKTIITTVHQPPSAIYDLFDRILLMVDGQCAYLGPPNLALQYFADRGYLCPYTFSPPDFFILILSVIPDQEESSKQRIESICEAYENSALKADLENQIRVLSARDEHSEDESHLKAVLSSYKSSWWTQFILLLRRSCLSVLRDQASLKTRLPAHILAGLFLGLCYLEQRGNTTVQNIAGYLALMLILMASETVFSVVQILPMEVPVFLREHHNGMYNTAAYFFTRVLAEIPSLLLLKTLYVTVSYWLVGLTPEFGRFLGCTIVVILTSAVGFAFGMFVSMTSDNITIVLAISQSMLLPMIMVGGFFIKPESIPSYMYWLKYTSWFYYGYELLNINEWNKLIGLDCSTPRIPNCATTGEQVLQSLGYSAENITTDILSLVLLFFGYLLLGYVALLYRVSCHRRHCVRTGCTR
ncbi:protein white-like [Glandiceps talaboti]